MQIDFHYTATYVVARLAGFDREQADIVAFSAQFVDEAESTRPGQATAETLRPCVGPVGGDDALVGHPVPVLFHLLPGNRGGDFAERLVCRAGSPVARAMLDGAIADRDRAYGLHRLGVALHVYADTWAHQGFSAVLHPYNEVTGHREIGDCGVFPDGLAAAYERLKKNPAPPISHRQASEFPDLPFLAWQYVDGRGETVERNNAALFCDAADHMYKAMRRFIAGDAAAPVDGLDAEQRRIIGDFFAEGRQHDVKRRFQRWLDGIRDGVFGFAPEAVPYHISGDEDLFEKAAQAHIAHVAGDVLPRFGIRLQTTAP